ncbi:hypothetical protein [Rufibacter latericius]|nr:hypothetical protein [Rufibacter latericius]
MKKDRREWDRNDWFWHNLKPKLILGLVVLALLALWKLVEKYSS